MNTKNILVGAAIALAVSAGAASAQELVSNGGFETGDFTDWTLGGNTGFTGVGGNFSGVDPASGAYQGYFGAVGSTTSLDQTIATTDGGSYTFSFDLYDFGGAPNSFSANFGSTNVVSLTDDPGMPYTHYSFTVLAQGPSTDVNFTIRQDPSYYLLDNVSVQGGVPEPMSWALMITGFFGAGAALRRRRTVATAA